MRCRQVRRAGRAAPHLPCRQDGLAKAAAKARNAKCQVAAKAGPARKAKPAPRAKGKSAAGAEARAGGETTVHAMPETIGKESNDIRSQWTLQQVTDISYLPH
jgi:hypothetical protein